MTRHGMSDSKYGSMGVSEDPPNSRLFIICSKSATEEEFRDAFSKYGVIEELWVVKDRHTRDNRGVVYIKYSMTSEAARALEEMNGKAIGGSNIKVMIAASREQGSKRDKNEQERMLRLFVVVPKQMTNDELHEAFKEYGTIDYANIVKDKETKESKGLAYIKYFKFSHAAAAYEQCDKKYKAVFAEPRRASGEGPPRNSSNLFNYSGTTHSSGQAASMLPPLHSSSSSDSYTHLQVIGSPSLNQDQLWRLFDIIPDMDYCHTVFEGHHHPVRSVSTVVYNNARSAAYAYDKLHGFEYPIGNRLIVKPEIHARYRSNEDHRPEKRPTGERGNSSAELMHLAETIAQATSIIKAAGLSPELRKAGITTDDNICDVNLPSEKSMAHIDAPIAARCFVVCSPTPPPAQILKNVFSRFGDLIDVYMVNNRNYGYAKYASKEAAHEAISVLHGAEVCGMRLKVLEAEERDNSRKRQKMNDDSA